MGQFASDQVTLLFIREEAAVMIDRCWPNAAGLKVAGSGPSVSRGLEVADDLQLRVIGARHELNRRAILPSSESRRQSQQRGQRRRKLFRDPRLEGSSEVRPHVGFVVDDLDGGETCRVPHSAICSEAAKTDWKSGVPFRKMSHSPFP